MLDNFTSVGPARDLVVGEAAASASAGGGSAGGAGAAPQHELVVAAGHGKNGGVAVLHGGVLPEVIREVELPGVQVSACIRVRVGVRVRVRVRVRCSSSVDPTIYTTHHPIRALEWRLYVFGHSG